MSVKLGPLGSTKRIVRVGTCPALDARRGSPSNRGSHASSAVRRSQRPARCEPWIDLLVMSYDDGLQLFEIRGLRGESYLAGELGLLKWAAVPAHFTSFTAREPGTDVRFGVTR